MIDGVLATFLHRHAERYPDVHVKLTEVAGSQVITLLERGEIHLGISLVQPIQAGVHPFDSIPLPAIEFLAACHTALPLGDTANLEIGRLARHPLLLLEPSFFVRSTFDAACRLAGFQPTVVTESRSPHTLLSLAPAPVTAWRSCRR